MPSKDAPNIEEENRSAATAFVGGARYVASPSTTGSRPSLLARLPWTMLMIAVGFFTVSMCVYLPLREENRQLSHELAKLESQAQYVGDQVDANAEFIDRIHVDPTLNQRLLMRMTNKPLPGTAFLDPASPSPFHSSPFELTRIPAPQPLPPYQSDLPAPVHSIITHFRSRLVLMCAGVFLMAAGLILGTTSEKASPTSVSDALNS